MRERSILLALVCLVFLGYMSHSTANPLDSLAKRSRAKFNRLELMAVDLIDELIYQWRTSLPVRPDSKVFLAGTLPPLGTRATFTGFIENHFFALATSSQLSGGITWVHCPGCNTLSIYSHQKRTVIGPRHLVEPDSGIEIARFADYFCYLDFSVEGNELVLRARILNPRDRYRIVSAKTLSTNSSHPPLLRPHQRLQSAHQARQEYLAILRESPQYQLPIRLLTKIYPPPPILDTTAPVAPVMLWLEIGSEFYLSPDRRWLVGAYIGATSMPESYDGFTFGGKLAFLTLRDFHSLTEPSLYVYLACGYQELIGPGAQLFLEHDRLRIDQIHDNVRDQKNTPKASLAAVRIGLELKAKNSFTIGAFLEGFPSETENKNLGVIASHFHAYGFDFGITL